MSSRRLHLTISGRVQGVSFRAYTATEARRLHLSGWVRNLRDGRVELLAEGPEPALQALLRWAEQGPEEAQVEQIKAEWLEADDSLTGFQITDTL